MFLFLIKKAEGKAITVSRKFVLQDEENKAKTYEIQTLKKVAVFKTRQETQELNCWKQQRSQQKIPDESTLGNICGIRKASFILKTEKI